MRRLPSDLRLVAIALLAPLVPVAARAQGRGDPSAVTVERIYNTRDFRGQGFGQVRWLDDSTYTAVEPQRLRTHELRSMIRQMSEALDDGARAA